jgi:outer membrane murein-binding lipoprotein Lpp
MRARIAELEAELEQLRREVQAVRAMHQQAPEAKAS